MQDFETQRTAYLPIIFSDKELNLNNGEFGSLPLIQSLDKSIKKLNGEFSDFRNETRNEIAGIKKDIDFLKKETSELRSDVNELKNDVQELKSEVKSINVRLDGMDKRLDDMNQSQHKYFTLLGIMVAVIPVAVAVVQTVLLSR